MDWDDLRFVLAVSRTGSALGAARALGVNQTTVARRIAHIEETIGADLFERRQGGYCATTLGREVAATAERIEAHIQALEDDIAAGQRKLSGVVRLTMSERLARSVVTPSLVSFQKLHPGVRIEMITEDRRLDVARGEADVALRAGSRPDGAGIVIRKLPPVSWSVYCSRGYAVERGVPETRADLACHSIIGMDGPMGRLPGPLWLFEAAPNADIRFRSNSLTNLVSNLCAGLGVAMLPCIVGDNEPDLVRCMPPPPELAAEMWLIVREDLRSAPHVRAFADFLTAYIHSIRDKFAGQPANRPS